MKQIFFLSVTICLLISFSAYAQKGKSEKGKISVIVENLKSDKGKIRACLFHTKEGFPENHEKAFKVIKKAIANTNNMTIDFEDLDFGEYAIAILHDEDGNDKMKTGIFGIPIEGYGISNNAKGIFWDPRNLRMQK